MVHIEQITPQLTWQLRRDVLYPGNYLHEMEMDEDLDGYHFGAFTATQLIGVVSLFPKGASWQFRKFAIDPAFQGQGIGKQLLDHITGFAKTEGATHLWCNARLSATGFYKRSGFTQTGETFSKGGIDYEIMEKTL
ncbi:GNAT family N-acetyltransferase [Mucilaginibacter sp. AW1-3]